jgi:hypothetical protein
VSDARLCVSRFATLGCSLDLIVLESEVAMGTASNMQTTSEESTTSRTAPDDQRDAGGHKPSAEDRSLTRRRRRVARDNHGDDDKSPDAGGHEGDKPATPVTSTEPIEFTGRRLSAIVWRHVMIVRRRELHVRCDQRSSSTYGASTTSSTIV